MGEADLMNKIGVKVCMHKYSYAPDLRPENGVAWYY